MDEDNRVQTIPLTVRSVTRPDTGVCVRYGAPNRLTMLVFLTYDTGRGLYIFLFLLPSFAVTSLHHHLLQSSPSLSASPRNTVIFDQQTTVVSTNTVFINYYYYCILDYWESHAGTFMSQSLLIYTILKLVGWHKTYTIYDLLFK